MIGMLTTIIKWPFIKLSQAMAKASGASDGLQFIQNKFGVIPDDIDRSAMPSGIDADGRVKGRPLAEAYKYRFATKANLIASADRAWAWARFVTSGSILFVSGIIFMGFYTYTSFAIPAATGFPAEALWTATALEGYQDSTSSWESVVRLFVSLMIGGAFAMAATLLLYRPLHRSIMFISTRGFMFNTMSRLINVMRNDTWAAETRSVSRIENHLNNEYAIEKQTEMMAADKSPIIRLGTATGTLLHRGLMGAYEKDVDVKISLRDLCKHVLILGGTSEGKTWSGLEHIIRQTSRLSGFTMFAMDEKGQLWRELPAGSKIIGPDAGQYRIDLLESVEPYQLEQVLLSVAQGGEKDQKWIMAAANMIRCAGEVARAYSVTDAGIAYSKAHKTKCYSFQFIKVLCTNDKLREKVMIEVLQAMQDDRQYEPMKCYLSEAWWLAFEYLQIEFTALPKDTAGSVIFNIDSLIGGFSKNEAMRAAFGNGSYDQDTISLSSVVREKKGSYGLNINSTTYGMAGRIAMILVKTTIMNETYKFSLENPACNSFRTFMLMIDEAQGIMTANKEGWSDVNYWNIARSLGVAGCYATQSMDAIVNAIGDKTAADNIVKNFRNMIMFKCEDALVIEHLERTVGKTKRKIHRKGRYESWAHVCSENGLNTNPNKWAIPTGKESIGRIPSIRLATSKYSVYHPPEFEMDGVMVPMGPQGMGAQMQLAMSAAQVKMQQALRSEDIEMKDATEGVQAEPVITAEDFALLPVGSAIVVVQPGNRTQADIVRMGT